MLYSVVIQAPSIRIGLKLISFDSIVLDNLTFAQARAIAEAAYACHIDPQTYANPAEVIWQEAVAEYNEPFFGDSGEWILEEAVEEILWLGQYGVLE